MKAKIARLLPLVLASSLLHATPQLIAPDDTLFEELNGLVNRQVIQLNLSTFPLSQAEVKRALNQANPQNQSDVLVIQRLKQRLQEKRDGFTLEVEADSKLRHLPLLDEPSSVNLAGYYDQYRGSAKQSFASGALDVYLQANYVGGKTTYRRQKTDLAGSYIALKSWNQLLSLGLQSRQWGGGHHHSLLLSNAARPFPAISLQREKSHAAKLRPFSWLGAWQYQAFLGKPLGMKELAAHDEGYIAGIRVTAMPLDGVEFGLGHVALQTQADPNVPLAENAHERQEIQVSGVDARLRLMPWFNLPLSVYGQVTQEQGEGRESGEMAYLIGIDGSHNISPRQTFNWYLEGTQTAKLGESDRQHIGYVHQQLPLGHAWGTDMRILTVGMNSAYRNNDITALVKHHYWQSKLYWGKSGQQSALSRHYLGAEIGWGGDIPLDKYISLKLNTSLWYLKEKRAERKKSQLGVNSKASVEF